MIIRGKKREKEKGKEKGKEKEKTEGEQGIREEKDETAPEKDREGKADAQHLEIARQNSVEAVKKATGDSGARTPEIPGDTGGQPPHALDQQLVSAKLEVRAAKLPDMMCAISSLDLGQVRRSRDCDSTINCRMKIRK